MRGVRSGFIAVLCALAAVPAAVRAETALGFWDCVERAVKGHPLAASGAWRVEQAARAVDESGTAFRPQLHFSGNYSVGSYVPEVNFPGRNIRIGDHDDLSLAVQADYLLYDWGRRRAALEADRRQLEAAGCSLGSLRQDLAYSAGAAFLALQGALSERQVAEASLATAQAHLRDLQAIYDTGRLTWDEVLNGQVRLDEAQMRVNSTGYRVQTARAELLRSLGLAMDDTQAFADTAEGVPAPQADSYALESALAARPDLALYGVRAAALDSRSAAIAAEDKPTLSVFANGTAAQPGADQFRNEFIQYARAGVTVGWEFWDWRRKDYRLAQNESQKQALLAEGSDLAGRIALELERSRLQEREAADRLDLTGKALESATEHFRLLGARFEQGLATNTEYLDSENQLTVSRLNQVHARIELELARWRLAYVSGDLFKQIRSRWPEVELHPASGPGVSHTTDDNQGR
ncbi:TolC family protein [bacterium]|nr:TolC family protein [bacterium]